MTNRPLVFSQIYVAGAVVAFAASFAPLWAETDPERLSPRDTYSLWTVIPVDGGIAVLGVVLILGLGALAVTAAARPAWGQGIPASIVVVAVVGIAMIVAKPNAGTPAPAFGAGAGLLFGSAVLLALTAVADIVLSLRNVAPSAHHGQLRTGQ